MKGKKLFFFSFILAIAAAGSVYVYLMDMEQKNKAAANLVPVYVAAQEIPARTKLDPSMFTTRDVPETAIHQDAITDIEQLSGSYTRERLVSGEQVMASRLVFAQSESALSYKVSPNHRAVTVPVNNVSGVAGFILPGDYVDCIVTIDPPGAEGEKKETITRVVAENIRVLAAGQFIYEQEQEQLVVDTVTMDAPVNSVSAIIQASERGSLRLVLRPVNDPTPSTVQAFRISQF